MDVRPKESFGGKRGHLVTRIDRRVTRILHAKLAVIHKIHDLLNQQKMVEVNVNYFDYVKPAA